MLRVIGICLALVGSGVIGGCGTVYGVAMDERTVGQQTSDKEIWSTNVEVKAVQCRVVLLGIVGSAAEAGKAEAHAKAVSGVRSVQSYLRTTK
jgi:hyperosmotically inducible protein